MLRRLMLAGVAVALALTLQAGAAVVLDAEFASSYCVMENPNEILTRLGSDLGIDVPGLNMGFGGRLQLGFDPQGPLAPVYIAISGFGLSAGTRDVSASAGLIGFIFGAKLDVAHWQFSGGFGAQRGTFELPAERLVGLAGWGACLEAGAGYELPLGPKLSATLTLRGQWAPIHEMADRTGQKYRGRGMPFVDFTGLSASMGINWAP
jgi:hypothetical protein